ncbi:MAG: AAA family ATPase [Nitrososphaeria archaeon]
MIEEVRLFNFLSHKDTTLSLEEGVNVFIGNNGSGKSSVVDAITYALFGKHTRGDNVNLVRKGASEGGAEVVFSIGSSRYKAVRYFDSRGRLKDAWLRSLPDNAPLAHMERKAMGESVSGQIEKLFKLKYDAMLIANIIQQGKLNEIIELEPSEFREELDELIKISALKDAYSLFDRLINEFFRKRLRDEALGLYDDQNISALQRNLQDISSRKESDERELDQLGRRLEERRSSLSEIERRLKELEPLHTALEMLRSHEAQLLSYLNSRRAELERELPRLRDCVAEGERSLQDVLKLDELSSRAQSLQEDLAVLDERVKQALSLYKESESAESEISRIDRQLSELQRRIEDIKSKEDAVRKEIESIKGSYSEDLLARSSDYEGALNEVLKEMSDRQKEMGRLEQKLQDYRRIKEDGRCPTCGCEAAHIGVDEKISGVEVSLDRLHRTMQELEDRRRKLEETLSTIRKQTEIRSRHLMLQERLESYRGQREALEGMEQQLLETKRSREEVAWLKRSRFQEYSSLLELQKQKREELERLRKRILELERTRALLQGCGISSEQDLTRLKEELSSKEEILKRLREGGTEGGALIEIDDFSRSLAEQIRKLREMLKGFSEDEYRRLKELREQIISEMGQLSGSIERLRQQVEQEAQEIEKLKSAKALVERAAAFIGTIGQIKEKVFKPDGPVAISLRSWALMAISRWASEYVRSFGMGIYQIKVYEKGREVKIEVYTGAGPVESEVLSGGEKVAVAIALRLAIARLAGGFADFMILDEPTVFLDEERRSSLINIVSSFSGGSGPIRQLIIITHDREIFENSTVDAVFTFEKKNDITVVTKETRRNL